MPAGREDFWNIGYPWPAIIVYLAAPIIVAAIAYGLRRRSLMWRLGKPVEEFGPMGPRIREFIALGVFDLLAHRKFVCSAALGSSASRRGRQRQKESPLVTSGLLGLKSLYRGSTSRGQVL